jgi:pyruvate-formate lyase-activating enzyme
MITQRLRLLGNYLLRNPVVSAPPLNVMIETTNHCNLRCVMCSNKDIRRPRRDMDFTRFCRIIDEIGSWCECIDISFSGEPLIHPGVIDQITYVKKNTRMGVFIETNGTLLDCSMAERLIDSGLDYLIIDIDGATRQTYESVRVGGDYDVVTSNARQFLALKALRGSPMKTEIAIIKMKQTEDEIDQFVRRWKECGADHVRVKPFIPRLAMSPDQSMVECEPDDGRHARACLLLWRELVVLVDGTIIACCLDQAGTRDSVIGQMDSGSILSAWRSQRAEAIRRKHTEGNWHQVPFCRGCRPINPPLSLLLGTPLFNALNTKKMTSILESFAIRLGRRLY